MLQTAQQMLPQPDVGDYGHDGGGDGDGGGGGHGRVDVLDDDEDDDVVVLVVGRALFRSLNFGSPCCDNAVKNSG